MASGCQRAVLDRNQGGADAARVAVLLSAAGAAGVLVSSRTLRLRAQRMLAALSLRDAELSIRLCDDAVMRRLNRRYRGLDRTTDVLAFAMAEGEPTPQTAGRLLGDVVISLPTAARNARGAGRRPLDEVTWLLAHGLLHLLGFDHQTPAQDRRMRARADALVAAARTSKFAAVDILGASPPRRGSSSSRSGPNRPNKCK